MFMYCISMLAEVWLWQTFQEGLKNAITVEECSSIVSQSPPPRIILLLCNVVSIRSGLSFYALFAHINRQTWVCCSYAPSIYCVCDNFMSWIWLYKPQYTIKKWLHIYDQPNKHQNMWILESTGHHDWQKINITQFWGLLKPVWMVSITSINISYESLNPTF